MKDGTRGVLSMCSIPSTPVTCLSLSLGYASVTGTVIHMEIVPLIVIGAVGHWGFYSLNDLMDLEWDKKDGRETKPLVSGELPVELGWAISFSLIVVSFHLAWIHFPKSAFAGWMIASFLGVMYNYYSKEQTNSGMYLGMWGLAIIMTGALYPDGGITGITIILMLLVGVHMVWMTIMGDLKDIGKEEKSIPERFDCKIIEDGGYNRLWLSARFNIIVSLIVGIEVVLMLFLPIGDGAHARDVWPIYFGVIGGFLIFYTTDGVLYQPGFDRDKMKKDIALHEIVSISSVLLVSMSFMRIESALVLVVLSVLWGAGWQTILYRNPLRFP